MVYSVFLQFRHKTIHHLSSCITIFLFFRHFIYQFPHHGHQLKLLKSCRVEYHFLSPLVLVNGRPNDPYEPDSIYTKIARDRKHPPIDILDFRNFFLRIPDFYQYIPKRYLSFPPPDWQGAWQIWRSYLIRFEGPEFQLIHCTKELTNVKILGYTTFS